MLWQKFKYTQNKNNNKSSEQKGSFGYDRYVYDSDCGAGFTDA